MSIQLTIETEFVVKKLSDLPKFKTLMENLKMKINKSELARNLDVDRRTIDKYLNSFTPSKSNRKHPKSTILRNHFTSSMCRIQAGFLLQTSSLTILERQSRIEMPSGRARTTLRHSCVAER